VQAPVLVRVEEAGESSRIAKLLRQVEESARRRAPVVQLANRMAGIFVAVVLVAAVVTFVVTNRVAPDQALDNAIALLIVTCPCALALATPLAITVAVGRAAGRGMLIKGGDALELLATPGTLVLDKTGTITEGRTALVAWHGPEWVKPWVLSLEQGSSHPLADGFRRAWDGLATLDVSDVSHVSGGGMLGTVQGREVRVGSPRFVERGVTERGVMERGVTDADEVALRHAIGAMDKTLTPVHVAVDGRLVAVAGLGDRVRDDAMASLQLLRAAGWRTVMLSGDAPDVVAAVGRSLDFSADELVAAATPEDKLRFVEALKRNGSVVMVGDGVNDAAAIAAASVGIGVHGGAEACLATADIYLTRAGLSALIELTEGATRTMHVIRRNIACSLAYNLLGAGLAAVGLLSPLIAAILMPTSSITVVLGSWYSFTFLRTASAEART
jgi:Cu2+-exporting ATPase